MDLPKRLQPLYEDPTRHQVICAHRRWAKTLYNVTKSIFGTKHHSGALTSKNSIYWHILPTYKQAKLSAWKMLSTIAQETGYLSHKNETELSVRFSNGSEIHLKGSDNPDSLRGGGLDGCSLDEWALQNPLIWTEIIRPALADKQGWSVKTFTPKGKNHAYDDFIASGSKYFYPADISGVIPSDELAEMKKEMSLDEYAQEMLCQFLYYAGQIYKEFKPEIHVVEPFPISEHWAIHLGIDWGLTNPTAVLFGAFDSDGNIYIVDEIYQNDTSVEQHSAKIKEMLNIIQPGATPRGVIDPKCKAMDQMKHGIRYSIQQEFAKNGVNLAPAPNAVIAGINLVKQMFAKRKLFIFKRCENLISELETYRWKNKTSDEADLPEEPLKVRDHAVDGLRYLISSRFSPSSEPPKPDFRTEMERRVAESLEALEKPRKKDIG